MENNNFNPKRALLITRIIYYSMLLGILFFLVVVVIVISNETIFKADLSNPFIVVLFVLLCFVIPAGFFISKKIFARVDPKTSLETKYPIYQSGLIIRLATCNSVSLFSIACLLITYNLFSLIFLLIAIYVFYLYFPTPSRIAEDINLTEREIEQFF